MRLKIQKKVQKVKGNAKVKIWGPNPKVPKKKDYTVMVDKLGDHHRMFVKIIAQKVVKPTLDSLLKGEGTGNLLKTPHDKTIGRPVLNSEEHTCDMCHMKFGTDHGLRIHRGKMHSENKRKQLEEEQVVDVQFKCKVCEFSGISSEEMNSHIMIMHGDPSFNCVTCSYTGVSTKEVENHILIMHSESVTKNLQNIDQLAHCVQLRKDKTKCTLCNYNNEDEIDLKRHIRDEHRESKSPSTSPPKKKTKHESYALVEDIINSLTKGLNLEDAMEEDEKDIKAVNETKTNEKEDEFVKRSRLQDEKVIAKRQKLEENERIVLEN